MRGRKNFRKSLQILITLILLVMSACGRPEEQKRTKEEMKFSYNIHTPIKTLDPSKISDTEGKSILTQVMEGLTRIDIDEKGNNIVVPGVASSWNISEDGKTWTFYLRDANWEDGKPVTAHDFEYGIKRSLDPSVASVYASTLSHIVGSSDYNSNRGRKEDVGVRAIDDKTLEIVLDEPLGYFLELTYFKTMFPEREDIVGKYENRYGVSGEAIISNGAFKVREWLPGNKIVLEKNNEYWDASSVKLDVVQINVVPDVESSIRMLYNKSIDVSGVGKQEWIDKLRDSGDFEVTSDYKASTEYLIYNHSDRVFSNRKIREAFSLAVDREELGEVVFMGIAEPAYGWIPPKIQVGGIDYRDVVEEPLVKENKEKARLLLEEGLSEIGLLKENIEITYLVAGLGPWSRLYFEFMQQMYKKNLGVEVRGEFLEWPVFIDRVDSKKYQLASMAWSGDYNDPSTFMDMWTSDSTLRNIGYKDKNYDHYIDMARKTADNKKRLEYFKKAEELLVKEEVVIAPTLYRRRNTFVNKRVKGLMITLFEGYDLKKVYIEQ